MAPARTTQTKLTYQMGPFDLPAGTSSEAMQDRPSTIRFRVDESMWVTSFEPRVEDAQGNPLPGALLHFAVVANMRESNPLCSSKQTGNPFAAATAALKRIELPNGHGYPLLPEDPVEASVVLRNPTNQDYHGVYFTFSLAGDSMQSGRPMVDVAPLLLDVDPCDHTPMAVEPKAFVKKSQRFAVPEPGHLIQAYGLLQDFGVEIELREESEQKPFWKAAATIDANHQIVSLPAFDDPAGVQLQSGDAIVLDVSYENFQEGWYNEATAAAMVYIARTDDAGPQATQAKSVAKRATPATSIQSLLLK